MRVYFSLINAKSHGITIEMPEVPHKDDAIFFDSIPYAPRVEYHDGVFSGRWYTVVCVEKSFRFAQAGTVVEYSVRLEDD